MPFVEQPKLFRLRNGSLGTEYEALTEVIKVKEAKKQLLEDEIEEHYRQRELASGQP